MPRQTAIQLDHEFESNQNNEDVKIQISLRKMAKLRNSLNLINSEISNTLNNIKECKQVVDNTMEVIGEINAAIEHKNECQ